MNFITKRDLVETAEFAWTTRVRGSRRLRCGCGGSLTCGSLGGGEGGVFLKYSGPSGLGSFFVIDVTDEAVTSKKYILRYTRKVVFSRVLGSRFFANSFFIVFSYLLNSFLIVFSKFSQSYFIVFSKLFHSFLKVFS